MGEYYRWINVDRKEYICPSDFSMGNKLLESSAPHNAFLCAFRELLGNEWRDSHIIFLGDSQELTKDDSNETLSILYRHSEESGFKGIGIDTVFETYDNISGWFSSAEKDVRREIEYYLKDLDSGEKNAFNEYSVDPADPYKDLFFRQGKDYRYTVNHTRKIYYSTDDIRIILDRPVSVYDPKTGKISKPKRWPKPKIDPIPYLMRHGYYGIGDWVGDIIGVSDEIPEGYKPIERLRIDY